MQTLTRAGIYIGVATMAEMTIKQVAERLKLSTRDITRYIHAGHFPGAYKPNPFGKQRAEWRIPESAVIAFEHKREESRKGKPN